MKYLLTLLLCLGLSGMTFATQYTLSGTMDVAQATTNPANLGNGAGTISGTYDDVTDLISYTITWQDLSAPVTNMHFHLGAPGMPGGVELGIPGPWASPQIGVDIPVNPAKEADLLAGNWYVNVHTQDFGGGEIRGQVIVTAVAIPTMSQWALFILALGLSALALVYVKRRQALRS